MHLDHIMHANSLDAYDSEAAHFSRREAEIHAALTRTTEPATDRDICRRLGYSDMNAVRPRLTELIAGGWVEECGSVRCPVTGKTVRLVRGLRVRKNFEPGQLTLL